MTFTRGRYVTQRQPEDLGAFGGRAAKAGLSYEAFVPASIASSWIEALRVSHRRLAEAEQGASGGRYDETRRQRVCSRHGSGHRFA